MVGRVADPTAWTTPADVLRRLRQRWETGVFLTMLAQGSPWEPLAVAIRGPAAADLGDRYGEAQMWLRTWHQALTPSLRLEHRSVGGRVIGANTIPGRVWVDGYEQLWDLLGVAPDVAWFLAALARTQAGAPRLAEWMRATPMPALAHREVWPRLVDTVTWIDRYGQGSIYLRQVDVPGVDTKFIETHRAILTELLDVQLDADRVDPTRPRSDFVGRYRFRRKPSYVRFRLLDPTSCRGSGGFSELTVRADELTAAPAGVSTVYVVENEVTYLAFPPADASMVIFGGGYAVTTLRALPWLTDTTLNYWGDIDTHGFAILNRLRQHHGGVRSLLMDRATLLSHEQHWVTEPSPTHEPLAHLHPDEADLYRDLVEGALGPAIRLEQERVRFSALLRALPDDPDVSRLAARPRSGDP